VTELRTGPSKGAEEDKKMKGKAGKRERRMRERYLIASPPDFGEGARNDNQRNSWTHSKLRWKYDNISEKVKERANREK